MLTRTVHVTLQVALKPDSLRSSVVMVEDQCSLTLSDFPVINRPLGNVSGYTNPSHSYASITWLSAFVLSA